MKNMVNIIPAGSCPKCGHSSFVVSESQTNEYLTNADGEIVDSLDIEYDAEGICLNCNTIYNMYPTRTGFVPLTRLREIMFNYTPHLLDHIVEVVDIPNPMEVTENGR